MVARLLRRLRSVAAVARRIAGVPDYDGYVAHLLARHPHVAPMAREEFYRTRLEERYNKPGARCC